MDLRDRDAIHVGDLFAIGDVTRTAYPPPRLPAARVEPAADAREGQ
jgi:hypothetical protein